MTAREHQLLKWINIQENLGSDIIEIGEHEYFKSKLGKDYCIIIGHQPKNGNFDDPYYNDDPSSILKFSGQISKFETQFSMFMYGTIEVVDVLYPAIYCNESGFVALMVPHKLLDRFPEIKKK